VLKDKNEQSALGTGHPSSFEATSTPAALNTRTYVSPKQETSGFAADGQPLTLAVIPPHIEKEQVAKFTTAEFVALAENGAHTKEVGVTVGVLV